MIEAIILTLIYICLVVAVMWLVIWVLEQLGVPVPPVIIKIGWVIVALVCILLFYKLLLAPLVFGHMTLRP